MANRRRGDVEAVLDGRRYTLRLTLGALAELEDAFGAGDLVALAARFESGRLGARDLSRILGAGLRGAGADISDEDAARMSIEGGATAAAQVAAELLSAAFGADEAEESPSFPPQPQDA